MCLMKCSRIICPAKRQWWQKQAPVRKSDNNERNSDHSIVQLIVNSMDTISISSPYPTIFHPPALCNHLFIKSSSSWHGQQQSWIIGMKRKRLTGTRNLRRIVHFRFELSSTYFTFRLLSLFCTSTLRTPRFLVLVDEGRTVRSGWVQDHSNKIEFHQYKVNTITCPSAPTYIPLFRIHPIDDPLPFISETT